MMKRTLSRGLVVAVGLTLLVSLGGCNTVTPGKVRRNMSPALATTDRARGQAANDMARVVDHNTRTAWDDFKRLMLLDKPSRLTPYPIP